MTSSKNSSFPRLLRSIAMAGALLVSMLSLAAQTAARMPLPLIGAEGIDQGSKYQSSGGGPVGDPHPEKGTGNALVENEGNRLSLDSRGNSLVIDLGQVQRVSAIEIDAGERPVKNSFENLLGNLELYFSFDNQTFRKIEKFTEEVEPGDRPSLLLSGFAVEARYVKVHSRYLGDSYQIVAAVTKLLRAFGESGPPSGQRVMVKFGLLQEGINDIRINTKAIRPAARLQFRYRLLPYMRTLDTEPLAQGNLTPAPDDGEGSWKTAALEIRDVPPGFYRLTIESVDQADSQVLWEESTDLHLVSKIHHLTSLSAEALPMIAGGEALVVTPGPEESVVNGWSIDRQDPNRALWTLGANRLASLSIPVALAGPSAVYLGVRGSDSAQILVGKEKLAIKSSAGNSADWINEAFFGVTTASADAITIQTQISPKPLEIAYLKVLGLTPAQAEVANGGVSALKGKRLIFYCDGYSIHGGFNKPSNYSPTDFENYADKFRDSSDIVERFDFSQGMSSVISSHLSKVPTAEYPGEFGHYHTKYSEFVSKNIQANYIDKGLNPIEVMGRRLATNRVPLYVGYRMNAWYDPPLDLHCVSTYWREHPEFIVRPYRGKVWAARSYAYPEVRKFNLDVIREMLGLGVQGIHLEFMRHPPFVGYDAPLVEAFKAKYGKSPLDPDFDLRKEWEEAQAEVLTSFVREVRAVLDEEGAKRNSRFGLTARFDYRNFRSQSLDVERWAREGLVDGLIPGDYSIRNNPIDLRPFQKMVQGTKVKVYSSLSPEETGNRDPTPKDEESGVPPPQGMLPVKDVKEFVVDAFRQGASGVYMFNNGGVGSYNDWRQFRGLEAWDIYENPRHLNRFPYPQP